MVLITMNKEGKVHYWDEDEYDIACGCLTFQTATHIRDEVTCKKCKKLLGLNSKEMII